MLYHLYHTIKGVFKKDIQPKPAQTIALRETKHSNPYLSSVVHNQDANQAKANCSGSAVMIG
jgi:hypothetical protein